MIHPTFPQNFGQPRWADLVENNVFMTDNNMFLNDPSTIMESNAIQLDQSSFHGIDSPSRLHDQSPTIMAWNATRPNPPLLSSASFGDAGRPPYNTTIHSGQINSLSPQAVQAPGDLWLDTARPTRQGRVRGPPYADSLF